MENRKYVFIMIDGLSDITYHSETLLEKSQIRSIDQLARWGINGIYDPVEQGLACGSDTAHMSIFGYNSFKDYRGRGTFESIGAGIQLEQGEIGFKCNFSYMDDNEVVLHRRVSKDFEEWGLPLIQVLDNIKLLNDSNQEYHVSVIHSTEHRVGLKIKGPDLTCQVIGTDPLRDRLKITRCKPLNDPNCYKQQNTSLVMNKLHRIICDKLKNHEINQKRVYEGKLPANVLTLRGAGEKLDVLPFNQRQQIGNGFMIAPTAIIRGIGKSIELDIIDVPGTTGGYDSDLNKKAQYFHQHIVQQHHKFGFLHVKGVDDAGHDKDTQQKIMMLEKVDEMVDKLTQMLVIDVQNHLVDDYTIVLTGDHTTTCKSGEHTFHPVPILFCSIRQLLLKNPKYTDKVQQFNELSCSQGILGRFQGSQIFNILKKYSDKIK